MLKTLHALLRGVLDGWQQGELTWGMTYDGDPGSARSRAYDRGATIGEQLRNIVWGI